MKKLTSKFMALLLALSMVLSMAAPAFAADLESSESQSQEQTVAEETTQKSQQGTELTEETEETLEEEEESEVSEEESEGTEESEESEETEQSELAEEQLLQMLENMPMLLSAFRPMLLSVSPASHTLPEAGVCVQKASGDAYAMFTTSYSSMTADGENVKIHLETSNTSYDGWYFGANADETKTVSVAGQQLTTGGWSFDFTVPATALGTKLDIVPHKYDTSKGEWSALSYQLVLAIPATIPEGEDTHQEAGITVANADGSGFEGISFTKTWVEEEPAITVCLETESATYDRLFLGANADEKTNAVLGETIQGGMRFTFTLDTKVSPVDICLGTEEGWYSDTQLQLVIPGFPGPKQECPVPAGYYNAAAVKNPSMFKILNILLDSNGSEIMATVVVNGISRSHVYLGTPADAAEDSANWIAGRQVSYLVDGTAAACMAFTFPVEDITKTITLSAADSKGNWSDKSFAVDYVNRVRTAPDGKYSVTAVSDSTMFKIVSTDLTIANGQITAEVALNSTGYTKLFVGTPEAAAAAEAGVLEYHTNAAGKYAFTVPFTGMDVPVAIAAYSTKSSSWVARTITLQSATLRPFTVNTIPAGYYNTTAATGDKMFKVAKAQLISGTDLQAVLTLSGTGYDALYLGTAFDAAGDEANWIIATKVTCTVGGESKECNRFVIPVADVSGAICVAARGTKSQSWTDKTVSIATDALKKTAADGVYSADATTNNSMFKVVASKLTIADGEITATVTLSGTGYDYLYAGKAENAAANQSDWAAYEENLFGKYTYTVPVEQLDAPVDIAAHSTKKDLWYDREITFASESLSEFVKNPVSEGYYNTTAETGEKMFKVVKAELISKGDCVLAVLTLSGTGYDYLYLGTGAEATEDAGNWIPYKAVTCTLNGTTKEYYTYAVPVSNISEPIAIAAHSSAKDQWYDRTVSISLDNLQKTAPDGVYTCDVASSSTMFKVVKSVLTITNGEISAVITMSGTGYDTLYLGTAAEAAEDAENHISFVADAEGKYTFTIPVSQLDSPISIAAHGTKWYDRTLTFQSETLAPAKENNPNPKPDPKPDNDPKPEDESKHDADTSGATSAVNNYTTLADGVYKPDGFTFSGGTGKVRISCDKVTVKNHRSFATLTFSSTSYSYVKANGSTYYTTIGPNGASVTIPMVLNRNNKVVGMTTKMSAAHEIEYTMFVSLPENGTATPMADTTGVLDEVAPEILGLTFEEEVELEYAQYMKIFKYNDGIVLFEVDMTTDSVLDDEELEPLEFAEDDGTKTVAEYVTEMYLSGVAKYLIVPEDVELPAGLDKQYIVISKPITGTYVTSSEALAALEQLELLEIVTALGVKPEDCTNAVLRKAMEDGSVVFGGEFGEPNYRELVKNKVNLVLATDQLLPLNEKTVAERKLELTQEEELTAEEYRARFRDMVERYATLGISMIIDRSASEEEELAQVEWLHLYGILFDLEEETTAIVDAALEAAQEK